MNLTLTLTQKELSVIAKALGNLPYFEAAPVIASVQSQLDKQSESQGSPEIKEQESS